MKSTWDYIEFEHGFSYVKREGGFIYKFHYDTSYRRASFKILHDTVGRNKEQFHLLSNLKGEVLEVFLKMLEDTLDAKAEDNWVMVPDSSQDGFLSKVHTETGMTLNINKEHGFYGILHEAASQMLELYKDLKRVL